MDSGFEILLTTADDYRKTCGATTWDALMHFVTSLKAQDKKIAFFSSTPQGGGVALMRHALVRLAETLGVSLEWYVIPPFSLARPHSPSIQVCPEAQTWRLSNHEDYA